MENLDFSPEALIAFETYGDPNNSRFHISTSANTWPLPIEHGSHQNMSLNTDNASQGLRRANTTTSATTEAATTTAPLQTSGLGYSHQALDPSAAQLLTSTAGAWQQFSQLNHQQSSYIQDGSIDPAAFNSAFGGPLQSSPIDFSLSHAGMNTTLSMDPTSTFIPVTTGMDNITDINPFHYNEVQNQLISYPVHAEGTTATADFGNHSVGGSSPAETWMECRSLSSSDNGWTNIEWPQQSRRSIDTYSENSQVIIFNNPNTTLHIRTESSASNESNDVPLSAHSFSSRDDGVFPMGSPQSEANIDFSQMQNVGDLNSAYMYHDCSSHGGHSSHHSPVQGTVSPAAIFEPVPIKPAPQTDPLSSSASPTSSGASSPPLRRKPSPTGKKSPITGPNRVSKPKQKPASGPHSTKKDAIVEKKVGRRRGPLRPEQRQQAHEIRKLRACLRCKFLKKTCDKGDPCAGCQPSHARLWQVPCTRIDIKDIAYFMKDWKADYERHVSLGFSVGNIKGFSQIERRVYITHGYGFYLPINAREVYVRDDKCFGVDWVESFHETPKTFETNTAKLSAGMEGVSHQMLSEYLDRHLDGGFERFVDEYFEGTYFLTEILKTAYRFYLREKLPVIRKALKLVIAYNLTMHVTMVEGLEDGEAGIGRVEDQESKFWGKTVAPVMINFQVKCALADMWRELQKDVLEELSALYSSVYSGDKLKNWPTIFMLAAILLAIWELMQFDCHYRVPDEKAVKKFCDDMESTPVGVIVGLFQAISQKLPSFMEWDTRKHHHLLNSNPAVCDAMTEVRAHVSKYESYLKSRADVKFDRADFDCLSNKFLSKLVIRAGAS